MRPPPQTALASPRLNHASKNAGSSRTAFSYIRVLSAQTAARTPALYASSAHSSMSVMPGSGTSSASSGSAAGLSPGGPTPKRARVGRRVSTGSTTVIHGWSLSLPSTMPTRAPRASKTGAPLEPGLVFISA